MIWNFPRIRILQTFQFGIERERDRERMRKLYTYFSNIFLRIFEDSISVVLTFSTLSHLHVLVVVVVVVVVANNTSLRMSCFSLPLERTNEETILTFQIYYL